MTAKPERNEPLIGHTEKWRGLRIGLLGGSFNPAHEGHLHISRQALAVLELNFVWWLVSPGNPLKDAAELEPLDTRLAAAKRLARHPLIRVDAPEDRLGTRFTFDFLERLKVRLPDTRFVWIMGADNLIQFPEWRNWRQIAEIVPIAVFDRPGYSLKALAGEFAKSYANYRLAEQKANALADRNPPAWTFVTCALHPQSATKIRQTKQRKAT